MLRFTTFSLGLLFAATLVAQDATMMRTYLLNELATAQKSWQTHYDSLKTVEDIELYQQERKEFFRQQLGKTWEKTPLNPLVVKSFTKGTPGKNAYRVEMILFESVPDFFVTGAMFLPDETKFEPPYPAVLIVCGHSNDAKAYSLYQGTAALAATHGLAAFVIDPIDQGERSQRLRENGTPLLQGVAAHNALGPGSTLLGRNTATFEVWDMIRALDYLESRPDIIAERMGVTGTSGGGTQTSYIMALDDRVAAAAPSCYICSLYGKMMTTIGPQDAEQNIFGQAAFGMDHVDYCIMRAPKPTLIATATGDYFPAEDAWTAARNAIRIYDRLGYSEKMAITEADGPHGWHKSNREAAVRWMLRWLADRDEMIFEADDQPACTREELRVTPSGEVLLIDGARSAFDLNRDYNDELLAVRNARAEIQSDDDLRLAIRIVAGVRQLDDIPAARRIQREQTSAELGTPAASAERLTYIGEYLAEDEKIVLPTTRFVPRSTETTGTIIYLNDAGRTSDMNRINELAAEGKTVVTVDLRGLGQTQGIGANYYDHNLFGTDGVDYYFAYLLGKSYVGMRTEDLLAVAKVQGQPVEIVASGETVGLVALHAAALEPSLIVGVRLDTPVRSWYDVVQSGSTPYPITNIVHGALLFYDVPELQRLATK
ncbi:MAG: prolyl oligopeptidase family serine peptidase [Planctomycetaceae bacterium]|nr:prolyl oligopeptidase family serine peptidase [Planctomycetaceae bacterium]